MAVARPGPASAGRLARRLTVPGFMAVVSVAACGEPPVLEVGGGRVGYGAEELDGLDDEQRAMLVDLTAFGLAVADRRLGQVAGPFVRRDLRSLVLQRAALEIGARDAGIDETALRETYERDPEPELVVRHLVVVSERWRPDEHRDSARDRARTALERARAGADFQRIVAEYSDEPGAAERGGLLQPGREGSWVPEFWDAARALPVGALSDVVETEYGFHVIRVEERRPVPFDEARDRALERLVQLPEALARSARWIEERARTAVVDTPAIRAWRRGEDPGRPLVQWPGTDLEPYRAEDLTDYVRTLPPEQTAMLDDEPIDALAGVVESAGRSQILLEHARASGIEATPAQRTAVEQIWADRLAGWARGLGFAAGQSEREIRVRALEAATTFRQEALLARVEVLRLGSVLRHLYEVHDQGDASQ